jgi:hypothetical protein
MNKQLVIIGLIVLLVSAGLTLLTYNPLNNEKNKFVGTWINATSPYTTIRLLSDGACSYSSSSGRWDLNGGKLVMDLLDDDVPFILTYNYLFSNIDKTLSLTSMSGVEPRVYTKQ